MERTLLQMLVQQSSGVALAVADVAGNLTMTTPALQKMLGRDLEDVTEDSLARLHVRDPAEDRALSFSEMPIVRACQGELVRDQVVSLRRPDGLVVYLRCSAAPLLDPEGEIDGGVCLLQDVTAEWTVATKQAELRDRLVRTINHELRTPLTKILGHCELLSEVAAEPDPLVPNHVLRSIQAIERAGRELAALAQRVTDLADLEGATQVQAAPVDLAGLVRHEVESRRESLAGTGPNLAYTGPDALAATVDGHLVGWALQELLDNAVQYARGSSQLRVELEAADGHVQVVVIDDGPGLPERDRERLLRPFERGDSDDPSDSSPGLGLAVVGAVAAAHGGSVILEDAVPHGLVVRLTLLRHLA